MVIKKAIISVGLISLLVIGFSSVCLASGMDYDQDMLASQVDGHIWMEMSSKERKAFWLGIFYAMGRWGEETMKVSQVSMMASIITSAYEGTGDLDKTIFENVRGFASDLQGKSESSEGSTTGKNDENIVVEYSGSGMKTTRPFTVNSNWEIQWDADGRIFQVYLQSEDGQMVDILANQQGEGEGSSYSPKTGTYYLKINAMGNWKIKIVETN